MGGRGKTRFARKHDAILFYSKQEKYTFNPVFIPYKSKMTEWRHLHGSQKGKPIPAGRIPSDVWEMTFNTMSKERNGYATQKPSEIMKRIVLASSNENDIVADFFCGSGSFLKVAHELGRSCIGCDSNQSAVLRLKLFTPSNEMRGEQVAGASKADGEFTSTLPDPFLLS
jgi:DNA modification methylase